MVSPGKPSPRSAVKPLSNAQVAELGLHHELINPMRNHPTGPRKDNVEEINAQNPKATQRLLDACACVVRSRCKVKAWGLERVPEEGVFITACTHVTLFDVFIPMAAMFYQGRRPRYMAKAEMASWPIIGKWFQLVGMQPVPRRKGEALAIENESIRILTSGRPLTIWPEGTLTRDPQKWPMSLKPGMAYIALEACRKLGQQIPIFPAATWGAASINHWWPWPRKNVVMGYGEAVEYGDLLVGMESWPEGTPPKEAVQELTRRVREALESIEAEIRGEEPPAEGYWDYRSMSRVPRD